jgi:nucleoside-diphosphate-sugar epimerase
LHSACSRRGRECGLLPVTPIGLTHTVVESISGGSIFPTGKGCATRYWIRFEHGHTTFAQAVRNTRALIQAASDVGVGRFVHVSITQPSLESSLPYFRGKAEVEQALCASGLSYAILRPTVFFGGRDTLINNIAWLLRRFPLYAVGGDGSYQLQPIHVDDFAGLAEEHGRHRENVVIDAVGPETFTFDELVRLVARHVGSRARVIHAPWWLVYAVGKAMGWMLRDVILTRDEIAGLSANLLVSSDRPTASTALSGWLETHAHELGVRYASELARHFRR